MKIIRKIIKQMFCKHKWLKKGNGISSPFGSYNEYRCPICKKIKSDSSIYFN